MRHHSVYWLLRWAALCCGLGGLGAPTASAAPAASPASVASSPASTVAVIKAPVKTGTWEHALSAYTPPQLPPAFAHFAYVNPDAPKGGLLRLGNPDRRSSFDKYNPFTVKGNAPAGVLLYMFEGLAVMAQDERQAMYGLLAESMLVAPDLSSISFRLNPLARFSNGDPVTPEDVAHSHRMMGGPNASPAYQTALASIRQVVVVDERTVRFDLKDRSLEALFVAGTMPVFSRKWGLDSQGKSKKFDDIVTDFPIASGPYVIDKVEVPRRIEFKRNPQYWARDLGVRRGQFNFDRIVYRMYADPDIRREAFKAGEFDIYKEYGSRSWARKHQGAKWRDGRIIKTAFQTETGQGLQSIHFNQRRPIFQDIRVREALVLAWDFEPVNRYGTFVRSSSVFSNTEFAAAGPPGPGELKLLEPFRAELPARVFGPAFVSPRTDTGPNALRENLRKARDLLSQAGWNVAADGKLRNAQGQHFEFEYLEPSTPGRNTEWQRNLEKLGIGFKERLVDFALYRTRLEKYDIDTITIVEGDFTLPSPADMATLYGSKSADEPGNNNFRGIRNRAADHLIEAMAKASTLEELRDASRALDRVVMWNFWQMPELYNNKEQASYWNKFGIPKVRPKYFSIDFLNSGIAEFGPWPIRTWWDKSLERKP